MSKQDIFRGKEPPRKDRKMQGSRYLRKIVLYFRGVVVSHGELLPPQHGHKLGKALPLRALLGVGPLLISAD